MHLFILVTVLNPHNYGRLLNDFIQSIIPNIFKSIQPLQMDYSTPSPRLNRTTRTNISTNHPSSKVVAIFPFQGDPSAHQLSFPAGAYIRVLKEHPGGWWLGSYQQRKGWFPSSYCRSDSSSLQPPIAEEDNPFQTPLGGRTDHIHAASRNFGLAPTFNPAYEDYAETRDESNMVKEKVGTLPSLTNNFFSTRIDKGLRDGKRMKREDSGKPEVRIVSVPKSSPSTATVEGAEVTVNRELARQQKALIEQQEQKRRDQWGTVNVVKNRKTKRSWWNKRRVVANGA